MAAGPELAGSQPASPFPYFRPAFSGEAKPARTKTEAEMSQGAGHAYYVDPSTFEFNPMRRRSPTGGAVD